MRTMNNGGVAFPNHPDMPIGAPGEGMALRDYFAAKAMQGFASTLDGTEPPLFEAIARDAYEMADAMLKARNKQ